MVLEYFSGLGTWDVYKSRAAIVALYSRAKRAVAEQQRYERKYMQV
jgi:hypothetical protein